MKLVKKLREEEKGSITMTVVTVLLFMTVSIAIAYFSLSDKSNNQSKKIRQIADSYNATDSELIQEYKEVLDNLNIISTMSIEEVMGLSNYMIGKQTNTTVTDEFENTFVVPAGFKVTNDADNVTEGMVIQDKVGNEFVWIPIGDVKYVENGENKTKTINLARYFFNNSGEIYLTVTDGSARKPQGYNSNYTEDQTTSYENGIAKNIEEFLLKTREAKGFYIGRYEARIVGADANYSTSNTEEKKSWTGYSGGHLVLKPNDRVFNYITQNKASEVSINMYPENKYFQSDLINSFAWDTATLFLQEFDNRSTEVRNNNNNYNSKYSRQGSLNPQYGGYYLTGTNSPEIPLKDIDKICNIYDIAGNYFEWTTETCNNSSTSCVKRGGIYNSGYTTFISANSITSAAVSISFRPILYIK